MYCGSAGMTAFTSMPNQSSSFASSLSGEDMVLLNSWPPRGSLQLPWLAAGSDSLALQPAGLVAGLVAGGCLTLDP
jgi:hypothetical protein